MVTNVAFLGKSFGPFQFWTFFLSIFENSKILLGKNIIKTINPQNNLKKKKGGPIN